METIVADLHLHTTCSDGLYTPESLCKLVVNKKLNAFSITDHDSVDGLARVKNCEKVTFIPGLELTATLHEKEIHILGYYIDPENRELLDTLKEIRKKRVARLMDIVDKLNNSGGVCIDIDELVEGLGKGYYGRMSLARYMVKKGLAKSLDHCFSSFIGENSKAYEAVNFFSPEEAIRLIHRAGGLAFLAHPYTINTLGVIPELVENGLNGIEAFHPSHGPEEVRRCLEWAARFKLGVSGGSDFHGTVDSPRQILSAGLNGERLVEFLALRPDRDMVTA